MIGVEDVHAAARRIAGRVRRTPVMEADPAEFVPEGRTAPARLWLKLEHTQHTGSFKTRGALNRVLSAAEAGRLPEAGVIAASGGNAGLAVA
ncbi:pyridoxal-phosphate dependent enzyme, partial [Actinomadura adrarensis]